MTDAVETFTHRHPAMDVTVKVLRVSYVREHVSPERWLNETETVKQLQHPKGLFGKALFRWMTGKTIEHAHWAADLMDVQTDDDVLEIGFGNGANLALRHNGHPRATSWEPRYQRPRWRWRRSETRRPFRQAECDCIAPQAGHCRLRRARSIRRARSPRPM